jgi:D-serine deaminase-like pyridoxal phosphate-dependent protein
VQSPREAQALAQQISRAPGLRFEGLMTYPPRGNLGETDAWLADAVALIRGDGIDVPVVSNGGTPDFHRAAEVKTATEHRPGTYIYNDRMQIGFGAATLADCALTVLATVVSRPTKDRAILDAGSKALAADVLAAAGHGTILEYPEAIVTGLSEEHGTVDLSLSPTAPSIGETVRIVPNHACVVTNLFDFVHLAEGDTIVARLPVAARGKLS